jgi:hypothetical protein
MLHIYLCRALSSGDVSGESRDSPGTRSVEMSIFSRVSERGGAIGESCAFACRAFSRRQSFSLESANAARSLYPGLDSNGVGIVPQHSALPVRPVCDLLVVATPSVAAPTLRHPVDDEGGGDSKYIGHLELEGAENGGQQAISSYRSYGLRESGVNLV